jgi:hypothetical protein
MAERRLPTTPRKPVVAERDAPTATAERPAAAPRDAYPQLRPVSKFGAAADGWDAYNSWLDRVRKPTPPSRQAVIAKSLYSLSSYRNWADKARGAFDKPK